MNLNKNLFSPGRTVLLSIFFAICIGTLLLMMPISQKESISFIDCFFTSVSSACVAGVLTVPIDAFTIFGKYIILILIQIGGIGLLTLTIFLVSLFTKLGLTTKFMVGQILELESWQKAKQLLIFIITFTLISEAIGAILIYYFIDPFYSIQDGLFYAIFHSISAFCSAGLSPFGNSLVAFKENIFMLTITGLLILGGTLGFITWYELFKYLKMKVQKKRMSFSLTTKVVISFTLILTIGVTLLLIILEGPAHFTDSPWWITVSNMLFNAISYRSAGYSTIDPNQMQSATLFLIIMYSLIGASPGSTGSGIKVTTFALFIATIKSVISGKSVVELKGRKIPKEQIFKAASILSLSVCWIIVSTFILLLLEKDKSFISIFFETVSSFTTLGLATYITPDLSIPSKILVALNMYIGRLGSLTFLLALKTKAERSEFQYPEERIMIS